MLALEDASASAAAASIGGSGGAASANGGSAGRADASAGGSPLGAAGSANHGGTGSLGGTSALGGTTNGGSANGGSPSGATGGLEMSSGGTSSGGSAHGGSPSGGSTSGGAGSGGAGAPGVDPCLRSNWKASASESSLRTDVPELYNPPSQAVDGDGSTRWSSGAAQVGGEWFLIDLGAIAAHLTQIALDTSEHPTDYPISYKLEVSSDGASYAFVTSGSGSSLTTIKFSDESARYLKITQTGSSSSWWSIHEISISCQSN